MKIKGRPLGRVVEDMVDGVLICNRVRGEASPRLRLALLRAALGEFLPEGRVAEEQDLLPSEDLLPSSVIRADSLPEALAASTLEEPARVAERHTQAA